MFTFISTKPRKKPAIIILFVSAFLLLQIGGCSDTGSVGGSFPGTDTNVEIDTLEIGEIETDTLVSFSGGLNFFSAGQFQDPLFGDLEAVGLIKPSLPPTNSDLSFGEDTRMRLRLAINQEAAYGDTLTAQEFLLFELNEIFRSNAFRLNDDVEVPEQVEGPIGVATVGSFTVTNQDTVEIELAPPWVQRYGSFYNSTEANRDSAYVRDFPGISVASQNDGRIIAFNPVDSRFIATNLDRSANTDTTVSDSIGIAPREWAYALERTNVQPSEPGSSKILNTLESVFRFDFDFSLDNLAARNISRVELVFPRDNFSLNQSITDAGVVRLLGTTLLLHSVEGDELPQSIDPGRVLATGQYQAEDGAYHIDVTQLVRNRVLENIDEDETFYVTLATNNGTIRSSLLFNAQAAGENRPKVIVTSINTEDN